VRNNEGEPWYNTEMKESDLPTLPEDSAHKYILSTANPGCETVGEYLLTTGEIVRGISTFYKSVVVNWVNRDNDIYLGIGVRHV